MGFKEGIDVGKIVGVNVGKNEGNVDNVSDGWAVGDSDILIVGSVDGIFDG